MAHALRYLFIDASGEERGKTMHVDRFTWTVEELSDWTVDGSSTGQRPGDDSDLILKPLYLKPDGTRNPERDAMVLCGTYNPNGTPHSTNHFHRLRELCEKYKDDECWLGFEQEYTIMEVDGSKPFGWDTVDEPGAGPQGPYYCSFGGKVSKGRPLAEAHRRICIRSGIKHCGMNAEVMPSQWEYQIGPLGPWEFACQLWLSRFLLHYLTEDTRILGRAVEVTFAPKPLVSEKWNGNGGHTNFSTKAMRVEYDSEEKEAIEKYAIENEDVEVIEEIVLAFADKESKVKLGSGADAIRAVLPRFNARHGIHMHHSGEGNDLRMSGDLETSDPTKFSAGVADRGCSIRIPCHVAINGGGYLEDRRYAGNVDPCLVAGLMMETVCAPEEEWGEILKKDHETLHPDVPYHGKHVMTYSGGETELVE